jgi:hypothetical protein
VKLIKGLLGLEDEMGSVGEEGGGSGGEPLAPSPEVETFCKENSSFKSIQN